MRSSHNHDPMHVLKWSAVSFVFYFLLAVWDKDAFTFLGGDFHFDDRIFQMGWLNHQLVTSSYGWDEFYSGVLWHTWFTHMFGAWSNLFTATTLVWRILSEVVCDPKLVSFEKERKALRKALTNRIYVLQMPLYKLHLRRWYVHILALPINKQVQELLAFRIKDRHAWRCVDGSW